jgi:uncharacterized membrane-anchored protein YjiN (DUF445 family)
MQEQQQFEQLVRMRRIAGSLLLLMAVLFVVARNLESAYPDVSVVTAFAEAAMVGGLADWFAVTALFRRPFGVPIPHTAIIPNNKDRIGESLANFLQHNFMTHQVLREELSHIDFADTAAQWLTDRHNSRAVAHQLTRAVPALLHMIEDEDASAFLRRALSGSLANVKFAPLLAQVLTVLVAGRQHHILLERILAIVARAFEQNRPYIRQKVHENSPRWIPKMLDEKFFERLIEGIEGILAEIRSDESEWRARFEAATEELIDKLSTSPEYEAKLQALVAQSVGHPLFRSYLQEVWQDVKQRLLADTSAPDSRLAARLEQALQGLAKALAQDPVIRDKLNEWLRAVVADTIVEGRDLIASIVKRVIRKWDGETVARKFELYVGKDLQYIRINGTLVGGAVGLLLHAVSRAM